MPFSERPLIPRFRKLSAALVLWAILLVSVVSFAEEGKPIHRSADREKWHRKENRIELFGHAVVSQPGETMTADYIAVDLTTRELTARGSCIYVASGSVIYGDEMHFNLDTRTGSIVGGRVSNDRFTLSGERINKLGEGRFQTHRGEYSTCRDCPGSWSLLAGDVDMQVDGYAYMSGVTGRITDVPAFWLPYLVVPMKTRRQTGLLFPKFSFGTSNGFTFVMPFFWAINRSSDMTLGAGYFANRGTRVEWEGRYSLSPRSGGQANFYFVQDRTFRDSRGTALPPSRWALDIKQAQELPFGIEEKLRLTDVSDNDYPYNISDDVPGVGELNMPSSLSFAYASPDISAYAVARWYRTLINTSSDPVLQKTQFDPRTVQTVPQVAFAANDRPLFGVPLVFGFNFGLSHFTRSRDAFDYDYSVVPYGQEPDVNAPKFTAKGAGLDEFSNINPIRKATRLSLTPSLYTTFRPFDLFSVTPSVKYFGYLYNFPQSENSQAQNFAVPNLSRGYTLFQVDLATQLDRVYDFPDDKQTPKVKHLIRPIMTYSYIPASLLTENRGHPFQSQIAYAAKQGIPGYYFDDYDIVPIDASPASTNYFVPLGNSLAVGASTQWIRRSGAIDSSDATYSKYIDLSAGQAFNFRELQRTDSGQKMPLTRFFSTLDLNLRQITYSQTYYYYPYIPGLRHQFFGSVNYALDRSLRQGLFAYDRSVALTYQWDQHGLVDTTKGTNNLIGSFSYSLSDYILPSAYSSFTLLPGRRLINAGVDIAFQSPSRCWKFTFSLPYRIENGINWKIDLALNLTGSGFGGVSEMAAQTGVLK